VTRTGAARPNGRPADVDHELVAFFNQFVENVSPYLDPNVETYTKRPAEVDKISDEFQESNQKHTIHGYLFGNLPGLRIPLPAPGRGGGGVNPGGGEGILPVRARTLGPAGAGRPPGRCG
jgi:hypothetical protein